jgi:hypothetical protein
MHYLLIVNDTWHALSTNKHVTIIAWSRHRRHQGHGRFQRSASWGSLRGGSRKSSTQSHGGYKEKQPPNDQNHDPGSTKTRERGCMHENQEEMNPKSGLSNRSPSALKEDTHTGMPGSSLSCSAVAQGTNQFSRRARHSRGRSESDSRAHAKQQSDIDIDESDHGHQGDCCDESMKLRRGSDPREEYVYAHRDSYLIDVERGQVYKDSTVKMYEKGAQLSTENLRKWLEVQVCVYVCMYELYVYGGMDE